MIEFNHLLVNDFVSSLNPIIGTLLKAEKTPIELFIAMFGTLSAFFRVHNIEVAKSNISLIINLFENRNFKLASEAIKTTRVLCENLKVEEFLNVEGSKLISELLKIVPQEKDNELKEQVVLTLGTIIEHFGYTIGQDVLKESISTIVALTDNSFMKVYALEVIAKISGDKMFAVNSNVGDLFAKVVADSLKGNKQEKLAGLKVLTQLYSVNDINKKIIESSLKPIGNLVFDNDPVIIEAALNLLTLIAKKEDMAKKIVETEFDRFLERSKQGIREASVEPLVRLTEALCVYCKSQILAKVMDIKNHLYPRTALMTLGFMYGSTRPNISSELQEITNGIKFLSTTQEKSVKYYTSIVHIYACGYLASVNEIKKEQIANELMKLVENQSDDVRQAVSVALGKMNNIIPFLFEQLSQKKVFVVAAALKEAMKTVKPEDAESVIEKLSTIKVEEDLIIPIASCYGALITKNVDVFVEKYYTPELQKKDLNPSIVGSIKTCMMYAEPRLFIPLIPLIVKRLDEKLPPVKAALFSVINYMIKNAQGEVKPYLYEIVNKLIPQLEVDMTYVKIAKFANVQHIIDSGVDSRKAVYETLGSLIEYFLPELDFASIVKNVLSGIENDNEHDIKLMCFSLLTQLSSLNLAMMAQHIEDFIPQLRKIIEPSLDEKKKDPDAPKQVELSRSVCKFVHEVSKYDIIKVSSSFKKLVADIQNSMKLGQIFKSMRTN